MADSIRAQLDESIADALSERVLVKTRHGALIKAAQRCADSVDAADEPSAAQLSTLLGYIRALGLAPSNESIDRRRRPKKDGDSALDGMRKSFHVA